jgi:hypothetical protein
MILKGTMMAPQFGCWNNAEDSLPPLGVVVVGVVWSDDGLPAITFLRCEICDDCDGAKWLQGFGDDDLPPPDAWAECRFTIPLGGGKGHGTVSCGADDEDEEDED